MARRGTSGINCLIAVDKPAGCTSHDVVARVRRLLGERRVGHAGTLDPAATGVMVLGIGQATRLLGCLSQDRKSYIARIEFGSETNTDDAEGSVTATSLVPDRLADEEAACAVLRGMKGPSLQVPPSFSAISVGGVRAYKAARAGEHLDLAPRPIEVHGAELLGISRDGGSLSWIVSFTVSKGTYIRALARDLGRSQGTTAHLAELRRTASGTVSIGECRSLDALDPSSAEPAALDPVRCLDVPRIDVPDEVLGDVRCGRPVPLYRIPGREPMEGVCRGIDRCALVADGRLVALAEPVDGRLLMRDVFPDGISGVRR